MCMLITAWPRVHSTINWHPKTTSRKSEWVTIRGSRSTMSNQKLGEMVKCEELDLAAASHNKESEQYDSSLATDAPVISAASKIDKSPLSFG